MVLIKDPLYLNLTLHKHMDIFVCYVLIIFLKDPLLIDFIVLMIQMQCSYALNYTFFHFHMDFNFHRDVIYFENQK